MGLGSVRAITTNAELMTLFTARAKIVLWKTTILGLIFFRLDFRSCRCGDGLLLAMQYEHCPRQTIWRGIARGCRAAFLYR
jgi:hypothetical protein